MLEDNDVIEIIGIKMGFFTGLTHARLRPSARSLVAALDACADPGQQFVRTRARRSRQFGDRQAARPRARQRRLDGIPGTCVTSILSMSIDTRPTTRHV